jgi:hypothetical protein
VTNGIPHGYPLFLLVHTVNCVQTLKAEAGAEYIQGREGKAEWNESLAMDVADNETEGTSIIYQAEDKGQPRGWSSPFWAAQYNISEFRYRSVGGRTTNGYWWNEVSYPYNTITDGNAYVCNALLVVALFPPLPPPPRTNNTFSLLFRILIFFLFLDPPFPSSSFSRVRYLQA